jgi:GT2 family glycosyltransferase
LPGDLLARFRVAVQDAALDVVIVSYQSRELLRACLESLRAHPPKRGARVWVVDNASEDGTPEMVESEFAEVELVASDANLGFAAANNLAIRRGSAPYVLALNPDTRITEGALDHMLELMESTPSIGISGCRLELDDGTFVPDTAGSIGALHADRTQRPCSGEACSVPRAFGRAWTGRRSQRRIHAHAP